MLEYIIIFVHSPTYNHLSRSNVGLSQSGKTISEQPRLEKQLKISYLETKLYICT